MNKPASTPPATQLRRDGRGDARRGQLVVADYLGQSAAQAAQAIRRSGLRPALERSLGCEPELIGQIVAQEPSAGSELARNAMVTLYVGAPKVTAGEELPDPTPAPSVEDNGSLAAGASVVAPANHPNRSQEAHLKVRSRRKPGLARGTALGAFDAPPSAVGRDVSGAGEHPAALEEEPIHTWLDTAENSAPVAPRPTVGAQYTDVAELTGVLDEEQLIALADDIFAGRTGVSWRRVYPTRSRVTRTRTRAASR
jgi:PASTA domain